MAIDSSAGRIVGREAELARLDAGLDALDAGTGGCVVIEGEPGIGKTRLLEELRARADGRGHVALSGAAAEFERDVPFSVWTDALDAYVAAQELELDDASRAELAAILPSLAPQRGGASSVAEERYRAHRTLRRLLASLGETQPLVVLLDDLHWSDGASLELISALLQRPPDAPVLLALAYRPGQAPERLRAAAASPAVQAIVLGELSEAQATEMLAGLDATAARSLYRHAGGNPFYLEQLARVGPSGGPDGGAPAVDIPSAVAASLGEELASLDPAERAMLEGAAVAGDPFEPDVAAAVAELPDEGLDALDALLARDLVRPTAVPRRFAFRHPLVRNAVYDGARAGWRIGAHARAAAALEARGAGAAERAHHVEQAARPGDERAIALLMEAGTGTAPRAPSAAARWFAGALRLLPTGDRERQASVRLALASALRSAGEYEPCRDAVLEAMALLPAEDSEQRVELTAVCAAVEHWMGRHEEAHERLIRAWDALPDRTTAAAAALQLELAIDGLYTLDFAQTLQRAAGALEAARAVGSRTLVAASASALCLGEAAAGRIGAAREHHREAIALVDALADHEIAPHLETFTYLAWAENYLEKYESAIAHSDRGVAIGRAAGAGQLLVPTMLVKGYPYELQGKLAEAIELCESAVDAMRLAANPHYLFWALFELGWARYYAGDLAGAIAAGEESARVGHRMSGGTMPSAGGGPGWMLACARFENGETQRAWDEMQALGSDELPHKIPVEKCFDWEILALVALKLGLRARAVDYVERGEANAADLGLHVPHAVASRARAALMLADGDAAGAAALARESYESASAVGANLQAAFSLGLCGQALVVCGSRPEAIEALRSAEVVLDACGSVRARDELRRELRRLGARAEKRGPAALGDSGIAALSKREREIAELVYDRRTNPQIAAELFLSIKTVETHLRNIFMKLGASSRVEVARAIERERQEAG